ncbi:MULTISPECIES: hypothetical protein [Tsukamurella]|uniref:Uncharacterized protein n=2 Tax=Tsukamurella TaxID=2060 RepID=A0A5C5S0H2_9ACTN|nr:MULTISPECIES: hypothetical protein [Tsukamurella]NMD54397.1 hypothetical protein [Tsukamurella columbiensis]TWS28917.1 hypothetical protein FK530_12110 [Tsukamurella conjunctivitidis]
MRVAVVLVGLAVVSAGAWFAFLGWDQEYYEVDGVAQGPYRPWQVIACGAVIVLACTAAFWYLRRLSLMALIPVVAVVGFAIPWVAWASRDDTGLWMAGLIFLLVGGVMSLTVWLALGYAAVETVRSVRRRRSGAPPTIPGPWVG